MWVNCVPKHSIVSYVSKTAYVLNKFHGQDYFYSEMGTGDYGLHVGWQSQSDLSVLCMQY